MKKHIIILLSVVLTASSLNAKELSKEEKKRVKSQLKEYMKDPDAYQRLITNYKETIDTQNSELAKRKATINQLSARYAELQNKVTSLEGELKDCQDKPLPTCPPCPVPGAVPSNGTVYKVQIGLYKKLDMTNYLKEPKFIGAEKADNNNRYVISYFTDKDEAEKFVADLRKLGLRGAFVSTYENGEKIVDLKKARTKTPLARKKAPVAAQ